MCGKNNKARESGPRETCAGCPINISTCWTAPALMEIDGRKLSSVQIEPKNEMMVQA